MNAEDVVEIVPTQSWNQKFAPEVAERAVAALEEGRVVLFEGLRFVLQPEEERFLSPKIVDNSRKNISFDPATRKLGGTHLTGAERERLAAMLDRFGTVTTRLMQNLAPSYAPHLERARTSFRPVEIDQRPTSARHDDRRLHVDAFPTRPMHGRRILRVFSNIAPDGTPRQWRVGEPFPEFAAKFLPRLRPPMPGSAWLLEMLGLTKGRRSAYDQIMLGLHDQGKLDERYQAEAPRAALELLPGNTWAVFTDQVLHAVLAGRFALEQTFHLPLAAMRRPELAPLSVLERMTGRRLV
jgi:hypothetical protein